MTPSINRTDVYHNNFDPAEREDWINANREHKLLNNVLEKAIQTTKKANEI